MTGISPESPTFVPCEEQGSEMVWLPEPRKAAGHLEEQALHPTVLSSAGGQLRAAAANTNHGSPEPPSGSCLSRGAVAKAALLTQHCSLFIALPWTY